MKLTSNYVKVISGVSQFSDKETGESKVVLNISGKGKESQGLFMDLVSFCNIFGLDINTIPQDKKKFNDFCEINILGSKVNQFVGISINKEDIIGLDLNKIQEIRNLINNEKVFNDLLKILKKGTIQ